MISLACNGFKSAGICFEHGPTVTESPSALHVRQYTPRTMSSDVTRADFDTYMMPNYAPAPMVMSRGEGSKVWDQDGLEYIDFAGGIAVNALGHANPDLVDALTDQARRIWHLSNAYANEPAIRLARSLVSATFADKVFFSNSGGEANEAALKLARRYASDHHGPEKDDIIAFRMGFHGRTFFTVSVGGQTKYSEGFGPKPGAITHVPFNDIDAFGDAMSDRVCAVMVEPIQGEGGLVAAEPAFLQRLRALCDAHEALLIFDEVQSGMGRTGSLYAYMDYDVVPDILTTAKALGGGFPIAATLTTEQIAASFVVGAHGSTYGGNPLATAVALRALEIINDERFLDRVKEKAEHAFVRLRAMAATTGVFSEIRGKGLWIGCEIADGSPLGSGDIAIAALEHRLLVLKAGPNVVRLAPALNIPDGDLSDGLDRLEAAVKSLT